MKKCILPPLFLLFVFFVSSSFFPSLKPSSLPQKENYGIFSIPQKTGWNENQGMETENYFVFENSETSTFISVYKSDKLCESKQELNKEILQIIQEYYTQQEFMEQRKQAAPYPCLGQSYCHLLKIKSRATSQRRFVLTPYFDQKMYRIDIWGGKNSEPTADALNFISQITLSGSLAPLAQKAVPPVQNKSSVSQTTVTSVNQDESLARFKKNKGVAVTPAVSSTAKVSAPSETNKNTTSTKPTKNTLSQHTKTASSNNTSDFELKDIQVQKAKIEKGNMPDVKFSSTDPCAPSNPSEDGLPWESAKENKIKLPEGIDVTIPPAINGLDKLSDLAYNSAVSSAFEGMSLVYGEMPENEAKAFQAAWAPLFDFPAQEVIDYLNKLNPIVSQFLVCREAYARNMAAIQMVMLDAATAIEFDEQEIWESAMAEASMYSTSLPALENAMKQLIKKLEVLGNPPSPVDAKCEARRRYQKVFDNPTDIEGCWAGVTETTALTKVRPLFQYHFKVKVNGSIRNYSIGLVHDVVNKPDYIYGGMCDDNLVGDKIIGQGWFLQKFEYSEIPEFSEISDSKFRSLIKEWTRQKQSDVECPSYLGWDIEIEHAQEFIEIKSFAPIFFETALEWTKENKWKDFDYTADEEDDSYGYFDWWECPKEVLFAFSESFVNKLNGATQPEVATQPDLKTEKKLNNTSSESIPENTIKEAIEFHNEMIGVVKHSLDRELKEREEAIKKLLSSKTKEEAEEHDRRLKDLNFRIVGLQSNIQSEMDLVASYKTGQLIHTRTAFDNYAQHKFINGIKEEVANIEATRRITERIERQIKLLPKEVQSKARTLARETLDGKTIASGDVEKAKKLVRTFGKQIEGYAGYDYAMAKEEEAYAEIKEQAAQAGIMIVGIGAVGFGSAALVEAYGAEAAAAIYGPKILGAIYGGTTGLVRGGPKEGLSGALMGWSPNGYALSQFIDGFQSAGTQKDATWESQAWEGVQKAGYAWCVGKAFELGVTGVTKGLLAWRGADSRLFKPVFQSSAQKSRMLQDQLRTKQLEYEAENIVQTYEKMEAKLVKLKLDEVGNALKIGQMEDELQQLTASMNASYHAKWRFKYQASPLTTKRFNARVQQNYKKMEPGMVRRMEEMGYKMDRMKFEQFRNANSAGSSSMDLDLVPVRVGVSGKQPKTIFIKKDGTIVSAKEFMDDCQAAMNAEYKQLTGISAPASDMNLVTSAHKEAFATSKLLDKNIDMSQFTDEEIASVGKVLRVKAEGIDGNKMLTNTNKMQAKARETAKEIENMMLRKLKSDLSNAPAGSAQAKKIQNQITYWDKMLKRFKQIGMQESDPTALMELSNQVRRETGGKDVHAVMDDVVRFFGAN